MRLTADLSLESKKSGRERERERERKQLKTVKRKRLSTKNPESG